MVFRLAIVVISALMYVSGATAQNSERWEQRGGWTVSYHESPEFWRLYHSRDNSLKNVIALVWADRRSDISMQQAFEEMKVKRGEIDNCPALITAVTQPEYEPYEKAMLALTKIKDPDAYASMDKDLPIIGYEAVDDEQNPQCALIAREFSGGAMLYAFVADETGALAQELSRVRSAVHVLMDDINEKEAPAVSPPPAPQTSSISIHVYIPRTNCVA